LDLRSLSSRYTTNSVTAERHRVEVREPGLALASGLAFWARFRPNSLTNGSFNILDQVPRQDITRRWFCTSPHSEDSKFDSFFTNQGQSDSCSSAQSATVALEDRLYSPREFVLHTRACDFRARLGQIVTTKRHIVEVREPGLALAPRLVFWARFRPNSLTNSV